jgi:hypothetical protein
MGYDVKVYFRGLCAAVPNTEAHRVRVLMLEQRGRRQASDGTIMEPHIPTVLVRQKDVEDRPDPDLQFEGERRGALEPDVMSLFVLGREDCTLEANWTMPAATKASKSTPKAGSRGALMHMRDVHPGMGEVDVACLMPSPPDVVASRFALPTDVLRPEDPNGRDWVCHPLLSSTPSSVTFQGPASTIAVDLHVEDGPVKLVSRDMSRTPRIIWQATLRPGTPGEPLEVWVNTLEAEQTLGRQLHDAEYRSDLPPTLTPKNKDIAREYEVFYDICEVPPPVRSVPHAKPISAPFKTDCMALVFDDNEYA